MSDQPARIRDRKAKLRIRLASLPAHLKMLMTAVLVGPRVLWRYARMDLSGTTAVPTEGFFGLCVTIDRMPEQLPALVRELGIDRLKVRVHIGNTENLPAYRDFLASLAPARIVVSILQDRAHVEAPEMAVQQIRKIFTSLAPFAVSFKIGNAINRTKWGFYSLDEYLAFYKRVQRLRDEEFPHIQLMGGGVIDFEMLPIIRTLFSAGCRFDQVASQLYIDRRGAPESKQTGHFDLRNKIRMITAALLCSRQPAQRITISETNWPLKDQGRYAPASGDCCVSEADYADYMVRYYLLALSTGLVESVYWHQLVAQGYGLVTPNADKVFRREAFQALKTLVRLLKGSVFTRYRVVEQDYYEMTFERDGHAFCVIWSDKSIPFPAIDCMSLIDQQGRSVTKQPPLLSGKVFYVNAELG